MAKKSKSKTSGICTTCGKLPTTLNRKTCDECREKNLKIKANIYHIRKEDGLCTSCGAVKENIQLSRCKACAQKECERKIRLRKNRKNKNQCTQCNQPALKTKRLCLGCWYKEIARRASKLENAPALIAKLEQQNFRCALTGIVIEPGVNASLDHIVPRSRGGTDEVSNLRWVDVECNRLKTDLLDSELFELCRMILNHNPSSRVPSDPSAADVLTADPS